MSRVESDFFIKSGYIINADANTIDQDQGGKYWTLERIEMSRQWQYHVYRFAACLAARSNFSTVIDLGCGSGAKLAELFAKSQYRAILIDQPSCRSRATESMPGALFIAADLEVCDIALDDQVDLIICADVLEHLFDPRPCMEFARGHIRSSGVVIFSTPERDILRGRDCMTSKHPAHVREWNSAEFRMLLESAGFRVVSHKLLPARRLPAWEDWIRKILSPFPALSRWRSCQVVVCRRT